MIPQISQNSKYLIDLIGAVLSGSRAPLPPQGIDMRELYAAANAHSLAPMVYHGLYELGIDEQSLAPFLEAHRKNMRRSVMQEAEARRIFTALEKEGVDYCALKGWFTRELYPDPSMRVMSDIDILVRPENQPDSKRIMEGLGYTCIRYGTADDDKYKRAGLLVEFHTGLDSDGLRNVSYYDDPWRLAEKLSEHRYALKAEECYLYTVAHALKHFMNTGAGIRTLIDIYLYLTKAKLYRGYIIDAAKSMGIEKFLFCMEKTAMATFGGQPFDEDTAELLKFMLECGVGGTNSNYEASRMLRSGHGKAKGSKGSYLLQRVFPPLKEMKQRDPVLKRHPGMLPLMYVRRWFQLIFTRRSHIESGFEKLGAIDMNEAERLRRIHKIVGIYE